MKVFILIDENNIVRCMASHESNLHDDKLHMKKYLVYMNGTCGDEYDVATDTWTARPENYPPPADEEKIEVEMKEVVRATAIQNLKDRGELSVDFEG